MSYGSSKRRRPNPGRSSTDGDAKVPAVASAVGGGLLLGASAAAAAAAGPVSAGPDGTSSILGTYQAVSIAEEPAKGTIAVKGDGKDDGAENGVGHSTAAPGDKVPEQSSRWFAEGDLSHVWGMLTESKINLLFVCLPFAYLSPVFGWGDAATFLFNFGAMIPLASLLGNSTEEVAARTNEIIGGFMNCTLGNIMEVIVSITALRKGYLRVVQTSLLGSVFSNMLLVLGTCFLAGGIVTPNPDKQQKFNRIGATTFSSLLLIACLGLVSPASFINNVNPRPTKADLLVLSRLGALILGVVYVLYLVFQMKTHSHLFDNDDEADGDGEDGGEQDQGMSLAAGMCVLAAISVATVICSELLVDSLEGAIQSLGLNQTFIGIILLPIIGNAAEHASAVTVAMKDKMDLALGVAIGSSIQIALFVIPLITLVGWAIDQPLTLDFHTFETVVLLVSVLITNVVISSGQANWLAGAMLLAAYVIIAIAFFFHPDTPLVHA